MFVQNEPANTVIRGTTPNNTEVQPAERLLGVSYLATMEDHAIRLKLMDGVRSRYWASFDQAFDLFDLETLERYATRRLSNGNYRIRYKERQDRPCKWTYMEITPDWLCQTLADVDQDGTVRLRPDIPLNFTKGRYVVTHKPNGEVSLLSDYFLDRQNNRQWAISQFYADTWRLVRHYEGCFVLHFGHGEALRDMIKNEGMAWRNEVIGAGDLGQHQAAIKAVLSKQRRSPKGN